MSLAQINSYLKFSKERSTWIESFSENSLVQIANDKTSDFKIDIEQGGFVHAL